MVFFLGPRFQFLKGLYEIVTQSAIYSAYSQGSRANTLFGLKTKGSNLILVKAKPFIAATGVGVTSYGAYQWKEAKKVLNLDENMSCEEMMKLFDEIDEDHSGDIDTDELHAALLIRGLDVGKFGLQAMMQTADEDDDGKISREEWVHIIKNQSKKIIGDKEINNTDNETNAEEALI